MLLREYGKIAFACDNCGAETKAYGPDEFDVLRDVARERGWKTVKNKEQWEHYCPDCQ